MQHDIQGLPFWFLVSLSFQMNCISNTWTSCEEQKQSLSLACIAWWRLQSHTAPDSVWYRFSLWWTGISVLATLYFPGNKVFWLLTSVVPDRGVAMLSLTNPFIYWLIYSHKKYREQLLFHRTFQIGNSDSIYPWL